jgi:hypothetical protein
MKLSQKSSDADLKDSRIFFCTDYGLNAAAIGR